MANFWVNLSGLLHDGVGFLSCNNCPCDGSSSGGSSGGGGSGSGSGPCGCCYTFSIQGSLDGGGLCGEPPGDNVCGCVEFTSYPSQVCSGESWSLTFQLNISQDCEGDLQDAVIELPAGWTVTNAGGGTVSGQTVTFAATANGTYTISGTVDPFYTCTSATAEVKGYVTPLMIERGVKLTYACECFAPCPVEVPCCPGVQIPGVLYANFDGGNCAGTYTMVWNDSANHWFSEDFPEGLLEMSCQQDWYLQINFEAFYPDSITCDPFQLVFNIAGSNPCGTFTLTITG